LLVEVVQGVGLGRDRVAVKLAAPWLEGALALSVGGVQFVVLVLDFEHRAWHEVGVVGFSASNRATISSTRAQLSAGMVRRVLVWSV
jgi:hypothetical protein